MAVAVFTGLVSGCDITVIEDGSKGSSTPVVEGDGQIELKIIPENNLVSLRIQAQTITIDWGDGSAVEPHTLAGVEKPLTHRYENTVCLATIRMDGSGISALKCYKYSTSSEAQTEGVVNEIRINSADMLTDLVCNSQELSVLNLSGCKNLRRLDCGDNLLPRLELQTLADLEELVCYQNQLTTLDLSGNANLKTVDCLGNQLTQLSLDNRAQLTTLVCSYNQLNTLSVGNCNALRSVACNSNRLNEETLNAVFAALPVRSASDNAVIVARDNPGFDSGNRSVATEKGWNVE